MTERLAGILIALPVFFALYTYAGYPLLLRLLAIGRGDPLVRTDPAEWPDITITIPAYNEEKEIADTVESVLSLDYPADRRQILVVSDASSDRTDEIVKGYADRGVELLRVEGRVGKTEAENIASSHLRGSIIVNTDASVRIAPGAIRALVRQFSDPAIGLASGRDVSVSRGEDRSNRGESGYVGYEMGIRDLETAVGGIVGASGCFYAIRADLHRIPLPGFLSRDFAAALKVYEHGYRPVSVSEALCYVPRQPSLHREYRRKVRTIARGLRTLAHKRALLNPVRHPLFAWKLFSHKLCRWMVPWAGIPGAIGLAGMAGYSPIALVAAILAGLGLLVASLSWALADRVQLPSLLQFAAYALSGNVAAMHALLRALRGVRDATWEPTRR
jgi:cellulose synthase/poly-beta-1,6-N-acetylglucosamine synthase-like glycosyltransferase